MLPETELPRPNQRATILPFRRRPAAEPRAVQFERMVATLENAGYVIRVVDGPDGRATTSFSFPRIPGFWPSDDDFIAMRDLDQLFQDSPIFQQFVETRCAWLGTSLRRPAEAKPAIPFSATRPG